jgi:hypothetical protein
MNIDSFLAHHGVTENPFAAEEARLDPVFERLLDHKPTHSDLAKILGPITQPTTAVVFGEKGSGKTALRLQMARQIAAHNAEHPDERVLVVSYDDLNPMLDNLLHRCGHNQEAVLEKLRIEDHQDAILALAVTQWVSGLLGQVDQGEDVVALPDRPLKRIRKALSRQQRADLAVLVAIYDQPASGNVLARWNRLHMKLGLGWRWVESLTYCLAVVLSIATCGLGIAWQFGSFHPIWLLPSLGVAGGGGLVLWGYWLYRHAACWWLCRRLCKHMPAINRSSGDLWRMLGRLTRADLLRQPWPLPQSPGANPRDSRYRLTRRLVDLLGLSDYCGITVLIDRVDEPTLLGGQPERMKAAVWPMLDNKFLKQDRIGIKMLLPIELRAILHRESAAFFQVARLDKQHLIDRLIWSGVMLYDLCTIRLQVCIESKNTSKTFSGPLLLTDIFEEDVTRDTLIDALDQMHQPRDAFKLLYEVIAEHCRITPADQARYRIARLTLDTVRRLQAQRVQDMQRGLSPG